MARKKVTKEIKKEEENIELNEKDIELLKSISENSEEETTKEEEKVDIISLDNKPVDPIITEETEEIPQGFVNNQPKVRKTNKIGLNSYNGRMYKVISDNVGMWTDNGCTFAISDLK